ncbi:MAG: poly(A) polymerase [Dehalococcoidia bacterium]|nr:poly(A) polymerase [Dehalococcoidia bacterium]
MGGSPQSSLTLDPRTAQVLLRLRGFFASRSQTAYCVGGLVRDGLLGRPTADVDVAVIARDLGSAARALAVEFAAALVVLDEERQVFRIVLPAGMHLDLSPVRGGSIEADLALRDFTIDALALPLDSWPFDPDRILDPTGGRADLERRVIRATTSAAFQEDPLRLLRGVRLAAEMAFSIDSTTESWIRAQAGRLSSTAAERVRDEFCRILAAPHALDSLRLLDRLGLLMVIVPELEEARGIGQPKQHYWDVLQHSLEAVGAMEQVLRQTPGDPAVLAEVPWDDNVQAYFQQEIGGGRSRLVLAKLTALLHDVSKPATKTIDPNGRIRFLGHPVKGAGVSEGVLQRLRFTSREAHMVSVMVEEHLRPALISSGKNQPTRRALYRFFRDAEGVVVDTLFLSFADYMAARGPLLETDDWAVYSSKIRAILLDWQDRVSVAPPGKLVDGHDIMKEFRLAPGPRIGVLLEAVTEGHASGEINSPEEALALVGRLLKKDGKNK